VKRSSTPSRRRKAGGWKSYEATGYVCDITARHEIGCTDIEVYPSLKSFKKAHTYYKECGGAVKVTLTYKVRV
jgi:hypothetical protein